MGRTITIEYEDDDEGDDEGENISEEMQSHLDEQEYNENDQGDTSFDPTQLEGSPESLEPESFDVKPTDFQEAPPEVPLIKPTDKIDPDALVAAELKKREAAARKRLREEQADERRRLREEMQDEARRLRREKREAKAINQEQITAIRSQAISQRVQAYSVSSVLGLPGYVGAAAIDQLLIRPSEERAIQERKQYEADLERYQREMEDYNVALKRQEEARIRNMPVESIDVNEVRASLGLPPKEPEAQTPPPAPTPQQPEGQPEAQQPAQAAAQAQAPEQRQGGGRVPPVPPVPPKGPGGTMPPGPPTPPTPPEPFVPNPFGMAIQLGVIAVEAAQAIRKGIEGIGKEAESGIRATFGDNPIEGIRQTEHTVQNAIDPFGTNVPLQVAVSGFDILLTLTEEIKKNAERDLEFSPEALSVSIEGNINKLLQQIDIGQRLDPVKAAILEQTNRLDMNWAELKAQLFENFGPMIVQLLKLINSYLEFYKPILETSSSNWNLLNAALPGNVGSILSLLDGIFGNTTPKPNQDLVDRDILSQISQFMNPNNPNIPGIPNPVP